MAVSQETVVDKQGMRPVGDLPVWRSVLWVFFSALTLGGVTGRSLACKKCAIYPKDSLSEQMKEETGMEPANLCTAEKWWWWWWCYAWFAVFLSWSDKCSVKKFYWMCQIWILDILCHVFDTLINTNNPSCYPKLALFRETKHLGKIQMEWPSLRAFSNSMLQKVYHFCCISLCLLEIIEYGATGGHFGYWKPLHGQHIENAAVFTYKTSKSKSYYYLCCHMQQPKRLPAVVCHHSYAPTTTN